MLSDAGYKIKVLNTINFKKSMHYNPFHYIRSEKDILKLVNTIIANTKGDGEKSGEDFWVKAERLLYCALIGYIYYEAPEEEQNFSTLLEFINASEAREDDEEFKNPVDELFEDLEKAKPEHFAVRQYKKYKLAAGKTAKSILISCGARLAPFDIAELRDLMAYDEMELDLLGDRRTALFVIISDTDDTFTITMAVFDVGQSVVNSASGIINGETAIDVSSLSMQMQAAMATMEIGELVVLALETFLVSFCMKIMSVVITVIVYGRMIEIYLYTSLAPIPFATMSNREWGHVGTNYFRGLFALAFQAFLMMVCVAIYAALISSVRISSNMHSALIGVAAYTVILCFSLMKTGSLSKQIFGSH